MKTMFGSVSYLYGVNSSVSFSLFWTRTMQFIPGVIAVISLSSSTNISPLGCNEKKSEIFKILLLNTNFSFTSSSQFIIIVSFSATEHYIFVDSDKGSDSVRYLSSKLLLVFVLISGFWK